MIDHMTFRVSNMEKSKKFYGQALAPLGYRESYDFEHDGVKVVGFTNSGKTDTWLVQKEPVGGHAHIAWAAKSKEAVEEFYKAAMEAGGKDNGAPGPRPEYHEKYYAAFVLDPDGNNIEACFQG